MTAHRWADDVGSVADEAGRLLESLRRAGAEAASAGPRTTAGAEPDAGPEEATAAPTGRTGPETGAGGAGGTEGEPGSAGAFMCDDPVCQWCPVCRASAFVRRLSPETLSGLSELAGFAATVLADLASARAGERRDASPEDDRG